MPSSKRSRVYCRVPKRILRSPQKLPLHLPLTLGLVGPDGGDLPLRLEGESAPQGSQRVLSIREAEERYEFVDVASAPVPSLARGFSAPVIVRYPYSEADLTHLMAHDADPFNRWEAGQRLALRLLLARVEAARAGARVPATDAFLEALSRVLSRAEEDPAFAAEALTLPSESYIAEQTEEIDPDAVQGARIGLRRDIALRLRSELLDAYHAYAVTGPYSPDARSAGRRSLRSICLGYLMELEEPEARALCKRQFDEADNMTDAMAALGALANYECEERNQALQDFYERWKDEPLVVDKWLAVQAGSRLPGTLADVRRLAAHPAFDVRNPNKVYALIRMFCSNQARFNAADGSGYDFAAEKLSEIDALNPQVAARIARAFDRWKRFDAGRRSRARGALERLRDSGRLSKDSSEIVQRALAA